jgi:hypothetical protein
MTFPRRYGYSALTLNLLCAALAVQVYPLAATFWSHALLGQWGGAVQLNVTALIMADFSAGAALIALLGKTTAAQTLAVALSADVFYALNEQVGRREGHRGQHDHPRVRRRVRAREQPHEHAGAGAHAAQRERARCATFCPTSRRNRTSGCRRAAAPAAAPIWRSRHAARVGPPRAARRRSRTLRLQLDR